MPCYSPDTSHDDAIRCGKERDDLKKSLDAVTNLLCATLRQIEYNKLHNKNDITGTLLPNEFIKIEGLNDWWSQHKKWDELRLIREANKRKEQEKQQFIKNALTKLTDEEKKALGL